MLLRIRTALATRSRSRLLKPGRQSRPRPPRRRHSSATPPGLQIARSGRHFKLLAVLQQRSLFCLATGLIPAADQRPASRTEPAGGRRRHSLDSICPPYIIPVDLEPLSTPGPPGCSRAYVDLSSCCCQCGPARPGSEAASGPALDSCRPLAPPAGRCALCSRRRAECCRVM